MIVRARVAAAPALGLAALCVCAAGCGRANPRTEASAPQSSSAAVAPARSTSAAPDPAPPATARAAPPPQAGTTSSRAVAPAHPVPAAFRPAPGAPSDEEVRRELLQMSAIERQEHLRALSAAAASLAGLLPWSLEPKSGVQVSVASVFTDYGLGLACGGLLGRNQLGVAHKTAPCGTMITFTYGERSITVPVIDRGPYVAGREWDLTGATAAALGFPGLGRIEWSVAR